MSLETKKALVRNVDRLFGSVEGDRYVGGNDFDIDEIFNIEMLLKNIVDSVRLHLQVLIQDGKSSSRICDEVHISTEKQRQLKEEISFKDIVWRVNLICLRVNKKWSEVLESDKIAERLKSAVENVTVYNRVINMLNVHLTVGGILDVESDTELLGLGNAEEL